MQNLLNIGYTENTFLFQAHQHNCWEIIYYTHGSGINTIGDQQIRFEPGQIICQPPGLQHSEYSENGYRNIFFCVGTHREFNSEIPIFFDNENRYIFNQLMQLHNEFHLQRKNWRNITESLLNTAYQYMLSTKFDIAKNPYVEKIENLLISNLSNPHLSYNKIMDKVPLSKDYSRRLFIKETGKTPSEYVTDKRISYAKSLLENRHKSNSMSVKAIAYLVGFEDAYYFSRVFKKNTGKSPSEWSTEIQDNNK